MNTPPFFIAVVIVILAVVALLVFRAGKRGRNRLTPLAGLAFAFVVAAVLFGENRVIAYSLMGVGVVLAVVDIFIGAGNRQ